MKHLVRRSVTAALVAAFAVLAIHTSGSAAVASRTCSPEAVKIKKDFVLARFADFLDGDYAGNHRLAPVLVKIWDGQGDCDVATMPQAVALDVATMHYYADLMTVAEDVTANKFSQARRAIDDYKAVHSTIAGRIHTSEFVTFDKTYTKSMHEYDVQVAKKGAPSVIAKNI